MLKKVVAMGAVAMGFCQGLAAAWRRSRANLRELNNQGRNPMPTIDVYLASGAGPVNMTVSGHEPAVRVARAIVDALDLPDGHWVGLRHGVDDEGEDPGPWLNPAEPLADQVQDGAVLVLQTLSAPPQTKNGNVRSIQ